MNEIELRTDNPSYLGLASLVGTMEGRRTVTATMVTTNGYGYGDGDGKALGITTYDLYLGVNNVHDLFFGMTTHRVELVSSMSLRTIHILSGSISAHLISQQNMGRLIGRQFPIRCL